MNMTLINSKLFYSAIFNVIILLGIGGCFSPTNSSNNSTIQPTTNQTSQPSETQAKEVKQVTVIEGLEHPWGMDWLPNGDILITERPGRLRKGGGFKPKFSVTYKD